MTINEILTRERSAHVAGTNALRAKDAAKAEEQFALALSLRQDAHTADPDHDDPSWLADALHPKMPGETERRYHRIAGQTIAQTARQRHDELIAYYAVQTTAPKPAKRVNFTDKQLKARVTVPTDQAGNPTMAVEDTEAFKQLKREQA